MLINDDLIEYYRPNMGIMLFNATGQVWLGRRVKGFNALDPETFTKPDTPSTPVDGFRWQMPQGGIDAGEGYDQAAARELQEETGVTSATLLLITPGWLAYNFPPEYKRRRWRGQRQKWAIMMFTGDDEEIDLEADDHQEFDAWRWASLEETAQLVVPFKQAVYQELVTAMTPLRDQIASETTHSK